jgi:DNA repair photolyase
MQLISRFDPWQAPLCTCPAKLTFNPYTGCDHECVYCYVSSYVPDFHNCRPKKDLLRRLEQEAAKLDGEALSISNSSDPYPNVEARTGLMHESLKILTCHKCRIQIITKSDIVTRDADLLMNVPSMVALTITTENDAIAKLIEPNAPPPTKRLKALETLVAKGIPTVVRIDPIIPTVNDQPENLIKTIARIGAKHVTASTYKVKTDNWQRLTTALPETAEKLKPLYFEQGTKTGGNLYLPQELRLRLMKSVADLTEKHGMKFGTCREGLSQLNTAICDGTWLTKTDSK